VVLRLVMMIFDPYFVVVSLLGQNKRWQVLIRRMCVPVLHTFFASLGDE
jgi:hypothetical protein